MADKALKSPILAKKAAAPAKAPPRRFAAPPQKIKKPDFDVLVDAAGFVLTMGILISASAMILMKVFHNWLIIYLLDIGFGLSVYAIGIKLIDILLKITGVRK